LLRKRGRGGMLPGKERAFRGKETRSLIFPIEGKEKGGGDIVLTCPTREGRKGRRGRGKKRSSFTRKKKKKNFRPLQKKAQKLLPKKKKEGV